MFIQGPQTLFQFHSSSSFNYKQTVGNLSTFTNTCVMSEDSNSVKKDSLIICFFNEKLGSGL